MDYYEYEYIVQNLIDILKEKKEAEEGQNSSVSREGMMKDVKKYMPGGFNPNNPTGGVKMPSIPSMPSYSTASFPSIPSSLKI